MARAFPTANKTKRYRRTSRRGQCLARARTSAPDPGVLGAHFAAEKRARTACHFRRHEARIPNKGSGLRSCGDARTEAAKGAHTLLVLFAVGNALATTPPRFYCAHCSRESSRGKPPSVNAVGPGKHLRHTLPPRFYCAHCSRESSRGKPPSVNAVGPGRSRAGSTAFSLRSMH